MINVTPAFEVVFQKSLDIATVDQVNDLIKKVYPKAAIITHPLQTNDQILPTFEALKGRSIIFIAGQNLGLSAYGIDMRPGIFKIHPRADQNDGSVDQPAFLCANIHKGQAAFTPTQETMLRSIVKQPVLSSMKTASYSVFAFLLVAIAAVVYKCLFNQPLRTYTVIS